MTQQIDTTVKAYCNAWLTSFSEANPYHRVSMEADDIAHIKVAIEAALQAAQPAQVPGWIPVGERLPEVDSGEVLVWLTGGRCAFDEWHEDLVRRTSRPVNLNLPQQQRHFCVSLPDKFSTFSFQSDAFCK